MVLGTEIKTAVIRPSLDSAGFFVPECSQYGPFYGRVERREYKTPKGEIAPGASVLASVDTRLPSGSRPTEIKAEIYHD